LTQTADIATPLPVQPLPNTLDVAAGAPSIGGGLAADQAEHDPFGSLVPRRRSPVALRAKAILLAADTAAMLAAVMAVYLLQSSIADWGPRTQRGHLWIALASALVWPVVFAQHKLYAARFVTRMFDETRRVIHAVFIGVIALVVVGALTHVEVSRPFVVEVLLLGSLLVGIERFVARRIFQRRRSRGQSFRPVIMVGTTVEALAMYEMLKKSPSLGYRVVGFVDDDPAAPTDVDGVPVLFGIQRTAKVADMLGAQGVIIAASALTLERSNHLVREISESGLHVEITWPLRDVAAHRLSVRPLGRFPVAYVEPVERHGWRSVAKRLFDIAIASLALVLTAPIWLIAGLAVKLTSQGPVFFAQERVGRWGKNFKVYKFRTMVVDAEDRLEELREQNEMDGPLFKMAADPRITKVGRVLRPTSIDELPQLINVLKGEMSLVGPRPALPSEAALWGEDLRNRLRVRPGITGMWQVSGRNNSSFADYERLDLYYVDNWSILVDLAILARTVPVVLSSRGAY
jgi:exopolysaccharide biosynthesis polyprenyl glycosylphosphotransferase